MATLTLTLLLACTMAVHSYVRVCYYTNWSQYRHGAGNYFLERDYQDGLCTHIIFSFGKVEKSGEGYVIKPYEWNDQSRLYIELNNVKKRDPNLKLLLAIGGWTHSSNGFTQMVATRASRGFFIKAAIKYLKEYGFDGLDLDWEFPAQRGGPAIDKKRFTDLCQELKAAFAPKNLLVTAAVTASVNGAGLSYEIPKIAQALDFINLMTYDLHGSWESTTGHHTDTSPERKYPNEHSLYNTVNHWISSGVPSKKLVLGLGSYGRTWRLKTQCEWDIGSPASGGGQSGPFTGESGFMAYYEICSQNFLNRVCTKSSSVYAPYGATSTTFIGYDDPESIVHKIEKVMKYFNMGGYMFWALDLDDFRGSCGQGRYPLMNAAKNAALGKSQNLPKCSNKKTCSGTVKKPSGNVRPPKVVIPVAPPAPVEVVSGSCASHGIWKSANMDIWCRHESHCRRACQSPCPEKDKDLCERCKCIKNGEKKTEPVTIESTTTKKVNNNLARRCKPRYRNLAWLRTYCPSASCRLCDATNDPSKRNARNQYLRWCTC